VSRRQDPGATSGQNRWESSWHVTFTCTTREKGHAPPRVGLSEIDLSGRGGGAPTSRYYRSTSLLDTDRSETPHQIISRQYAALS